MALSVGGVVIPVTMDTSLGTWVVRLYDGGEVLKIWMRGSCAFKGLEGLLSLSLSFSRDYGPGWSEWRRQTRKSCGAKSCGR